MATGNAKRFVEIGTSPRLATELAAQITAGIGNQRRLIELGLPPVSGKLVASVISSGSVSNNRLAETSLEPRFIKELKAQVGSAATLPQPSFLVAKWSSDDLPVVADGTAVASWVDSIGLVDAAQTTAGNRPVYRTNRSPSGKPSVQAASASKFLDAGRPAAILSALNGTLGAMVVVLRNAGAGTPPYGCPAGFQQGLGASGIFAPTLHSTGVGQGNNITPNTRLNGWSASGFNILIITKNTADTPNRGRVYINGTAIAVLGAVGSGTGNLVLGTGDGFTTTSEIHDVLVYGGTRIEQCDVLQIVKWACDKHGEAYPWSAASDYQIYDGDSTIRGVGGTNGYDMPNVVTRGLGRAIGTYTNIGVPSCTMLDMISHGAAEIDTATAITGKTVKLFAYEFTNQASLSGATLIARAKTYLSARKAAQPSIKIAFGDSIAVGLDTTDGTTLSAQGSNRVSYNSLVAGLTSADGADAVVKMSLNSNIGIINANPFGASYPTTYWADVSHPTGSATTPNGYTEFASVVSPVMATL